MSLKLFKAITFTSAALLASTAMAADGTINFTGELIAASCDMTGGSGTAIDGQDKQQIINIDLGKVSMDSVGNSSSTSSIAAGKNINVNLNCSNTGTPLKSVKVAFDPSSGSGFDANNSALLAIQKGGATGVGIGLYDNNNKQIDLRAGEYYTAPLVSDGNKYSADLNIRAAYVANGVQMTPGAANATMPFTLTYE